jgi:4-alpha-glucanotransferase
MQQSFVNSDNIKLNGENMFKRSLGTLLPIISLPSKYGIGTLGREAYNFIDFLEKSGQKYWQVLPLGPVSYGDSPYSSFSSFAGNPCLIDLEVFICEGIVKEDDLRDLIPHDDEHVDYELQFNKRYDVLRIIYENKKTTYGDEISNFKNDNKWAEDYALFMSLKYKNNQIPWYEWDSDLVARNEEKIDEARTLLGDEIEFWIFLQFAFYNQYASLKKYAAEKGISIIGDIPIYAAMDSADVWCNPDIFMLDENYRPTLAAGVPPDSFSAEGQLWGNPVYNWENLRKTNYSWWIERIKFSLKLYDAVRIDHFRGFDEFYAVPWGYDDAVNGKWMKAYGRELFQVLNEQYGNVNVIAEDLGIITESVIKLKEDTLFPGMKVLQFAFDKNPMNPYLPLNYEENCVAYTGTHDNDTLKGWLEKLDESSIDYVKKSLEINGDDFTDTKDLIYEIIDILCQSRANLCIVLLQDFLCLGSYARMNTPSTLGNNWTWRFTDKMLTDDLAEKIRTMALKTGRY